MSKRDKLRRKLRNHPKGRNQQEIQTFLGHFGFVLDRVSGSHHVFVLQDRGTTHRIVVPIHAQQIKTVYVKQILEKIDELFPEVEHDSSEADDVEY